jgi:hypothetical protein
MFARQERTTVTFEVWAPVCLCLRCGAAALAIVTAVDAQGGEAVSRGTRDPEGWERLWLGETTGHLCPECKIVVGQALTAAGVKGGG